MEGTEKNNALYANAVKVVVIFGLISLFGDIVYEGMRGSYGPYLETIGIKLSEFAFIVGIGEFLAYSLRLLAGAASDKTKKYWWFIYLGYGLLIVVPLIGFIDGKRFLPALLAFMMIERIGKALRNPAKDTILSHVADSAGGKLGMGFAFGLQEALDKLGAFLGPMIFTVVFLVTKNLKGPDHVIGAVEYRTGFKFMIIPYVLLMLVVFIAHRKVTSEKLMEVKDRPASKADKLQGVFWIYTVFTFLALLGFAQLPLIAYHIKAKNILPDAQIMMLYSMVMVIDALFALAIGHIYDRVKKKTGNKKAGLLTLLFIPFVTALVPFLALGNSIPLLIAGLVCYGMILGAHETIMRSAIADITSLRKRGTGYGIFNTAYGLALLAGSNLFGYLYENFGISTIQIVFVVAEVLAVILFMIMRFQIKKAA